MTITLPTFDHTYEGVTYRAEHAVVTEFTLGREDHGIFTAKITFAGEGWSQGLPAFFLENDHGGAFIAALVDRLGTPWRGIGVKTPVVVFREGKGRSALISGFAVVKGAVLGSPFFGWEYANG